MTPQEKKSQLYEHSSIRSAKNNLRLALAAVEHIESINSGIPEPKITRG